MRDQYKCRYCGEVFTLHTHCNPKGAKEIMHRFRDGAEIVSYYGVQVCSKEMHYGSDHYAIADFVGFVEDREDDKDTLSTDLEVLFDNAVDIIQLTEDCGMSVDEYAEVNEKAIQIRDIIQERFF